MTLHLIRHGQKFEHVGDPGLTDLGKQQSKETGVYLQRFPIAEIWSSPLARTAQTAQGIAQELGLEFQESPLLLERMNWGDDSISREEFIDEWIASTRNREYVPRFGDSSRQTGKRVEQLLAQLPSRPQEHVVFVTHGGTIADFLRNFFPDDELVPLYKEYQEGREFSVYNCSITTLELEPQLTPQHLNFVDHLSAVTE